MNGQKARRIRRKHGVAHARLARMRNPYHKGKPRRYKLDLLKGDKVAATVIIPGLMATAIRRPLR